jgi:hypothetical protein
MLPRGVADIEVGNRMIWAAVVFRPLEKSWAQIEAIAGCDQRHGQPNSTKNSDCFQTYINLSSGHARKRYCDCGHLRSPWLRLEDDDC